MDKKQQIQKIERQFMWLGVIDSIPMIMLGLALHAKFGGAGKPVFAFLENESTVAAMFAVSIPILTFCAFKAIKLALEKRRLERDGLQ